jgi:carbonic anhydrase
MQGNAHPEGQVNALVDAIKPAVLTAQGQPGDLVDNSVRANVLLEVEKLKSSDIISHALKDRTIGLMGARYDLGTGAVGVVTS